MKKKYAFIIVTLFSINLNAQNFVWATSIGDAATEVGTSVAVDPTGNVISAGHFRLTPDFDPGVGTFTMTSNGDFDICVIKLNSSGNFVWAKKIGSTLQDRAYGMTTDASGNIYVTGLFTGTPDFDPGPGTFTIASMGATDIYILKLDAAGNFVWAKAMGSNIGSEEGHSIFVDPAGNVYSTGMFSQTVDFDPGPGVFNIFYPASATYIQKLNSAGNFVWAKALPAQTGNGISVDASGNVYTVGNFSGSPDFDPGPGVATLTNNGATDIFISKLDASGNYVWAKAMGGASNDDGLSISLDGSGNVLTTGYFQTSADFDPGPLGWVYTSNGITDIFVSKLDASGNFVWAKQFGDVNPDQGFAITTDASGAVYSGGLCRGTIDFDPGPGVFNMTAPFTCAYISKLDAGGNFVWALQFASNSDVASLAVDAANSVYVCGSHGGGDFDPGPGTFNLSAMGMGDIYTCKLASCTGAPSQPGTINGPVNLCSGAGAQTYSVSPVAGASSYSWNLPSGWTGTSSSNTISATTSTTSGNISITAVNGCGSSVPQTLSVTINQTPSAPATISGSISICEFTSQTYSVVPVSGATSYSWSTPGGFTGTSATNILTVTAGPNSGNINVTAINACGSSTAQVLAVQVNNVPLQPSPISGSVTMCSGSGPKTYSVTFASSSLNYIWTLPSGWSGSSTSNTISGTPGTSGTISVTATYSCGTSPTRTLAVTVNSIPTASASTTQSLTCVNATATLNGSGVSTYTWSGPGIVSGSNTASSIVNMAGTYSLVGTTSGCVSNIVTVSLTSNTIAPSVSVTATSNSICIGNSATLTASGASTYSWNTSSTATSIVVGPTITTNYTLTGTNSVNGCTNTINKSIGVNPLPTITANTSNSIICGPPFQGTATVTASGASTYTWNTSATTTAIAVSPSVTTNYTVTGMDINGCVNTTAFTQSVSACTGITEPNTNPELIIYPNPTSGLLNIKAKAGLQVNVYNIIGELILNTELKTDTIELDLSNQANGIYFVRIGSVTKKIIKE